MRGEAERSWYQNPWLWGTGGCCLGCVGIPLLFIALAGGGAIYALHGTGVQQEAMARLRADAQAADALGEPIEAGWMIQGSVNVSNEGGEADFSVPVSGPKGEGRLHVVAFRRAGEWEFEEMVLVLPREDGDEVIDLLAAEPGTRL